MAITILDDIKVSRGIEVNNLGFNSELMMYINSAKSKLVQIGVDDMDITIDEDTAWPTFQNDTLGSLVKSYMSLVVGQIFDPSASPVISGAIGSVVGELEGRIMHEIDEIEAAAV